MCLSGQLLCVCPLLDNNRAVFEIICESALRLKMVLGFFPELV